MIEPDFVDIVTLLRSPDRFEPYTCNAAADEIERLRKEAFHLAANQCHSGYAGEYGHHRCSEIDRLTKERDEARWEVCGFHHLTGFLAGDYAISRGWNYFNDERKWPKFPQSVTDFKLFLEGQDKIFLESNDRLRKERDEARRLYCEAVEEIEHGMTNETKRMVANYLGWDCFNTPEPKIDKTLNGVIIDGGKAVPSKYEGLDDD